MMWGEGKSFCFVCSAVFPLWAIVAVSESRLLRFYYDSSFRQHCETFGVTVPLVTSSYLCPVGWLAGYGGLSIRISGGH